MIDGKPISFYYDTDYEEWVLGKYVGDKKDVVLPSATTEIPSYCVGYYAFSNPDTNTGLPIESITFSDAVTGIDYGAFYGCGKLTNIILPQSLKSLGMYTFNNTGLIDIYCYAEEIPSTSIGTFNNIDLSEVTLHVRESDIPLYKAIDPWNKFGSIVALTEEETGIETTSISNNEVQSYYSLDGKHLDAPQKGINIVKLANGQTKKVVIK